MIKEKKVKLTAFRVTETMHQQIKTANFDVAKSVRMHLKSRFENQPPK